MYYPKLYTLLVTMSSALSLPLAPYTLDPNP